MRRVHDQNSKVLLNSMPADVQLLKYRPSQKPGIVGQFVFENYKLLRKINLWQRPWHLVLHCWIKQNTPHHCTTFRGKRVFRFFCVNADIGTEIQIRHSYVARPALALDARKLETQCPPQHRHKIYQTNSQLQNLPIFLETFRHYTRNNS